MALIKCSECGREISDKAQLCIGCGAPIKIALNTILSEPLAVVYNKNTDTFTGTMKLIVKLAMRAIIELGWTLEQANETVGLVSFQTTVSWGSWSGIAGSLYIEEVSQYTYSINGTGKQNIRGGQLIALNIGNEAKRKANNAIDKMKELASVSHSLIINPEKNIDLIESEVQNEIYTKKLEELKEKISIEKKKFFGGSVTHEIDTLLKELCNTKDNAIYLIKAYNEVYSKDLISELKGLNTSYDSIKRNVFIFIELDIVEDKFPHNYKST